MTAPRTPTSPWRRGLALIGVGAVVAVLAPAVAHSTDAVKVAPLHRATATLLPGEYFVKTVDGTGTRATDDTRRQAVTASERAAAAGGQIVRTYETLGGFYARLTPEQLDAVRRDPSVKSVREGEERDIRDLIGKRAAPSASGPSGVVSSTPRGGTQRSPGWNLDRIDQRSVPLDQSYSYKATGKGVTIFVLDSGLNTKHQEFRGRNLGGKGFYSGNGTMSDDYEDCFGHGSHVSGIAAGTTYGVAKEASLYSLRVFTCKGRNKEADTAAAADWLLRVVRKPAVVNLSVGEEKSPEGSALESAVKKLITMGIPVVAAAGNDSDGKCATSPAWLPEVITVAGLNQREKIDVVSNFGPCVDIFAPGEDIVSAWHSSTNGTDKRSGTSMACPHVAGAAAMYLETRPDATPDEVSKALIAASTKGKITGLTSDTPNNLLYVADIPAGNLPAPQPPQPGPAQPGPSQPAPQPTQPQPQPTQPPGPWPTPPAPQPTAPPAPQPTQPPGPWPTQPPRPTQPQPPRPTPTQPTQPPGSQPTRPRPTWPMPMPSRP